MHKIIYLSSSIKLLSEDEINLLLVQSRHYNIANNITGVLLYLEGDFLQILEGNQENLTTLFNKIKTDKRHKGIIVVFDEAIEKRQFSDWSMGFHSTTYENLRHVKGLESLDKRELLSTKDNGILGFLDIFIKTHSEIISFW